MLEESSSLPKEVAQPEIPLSYGVEHTGQVLGQVVVDSAQRTADALNNLKQRLPKTADALGSPHNLPTPWESDSPAALAMNALNSADIENHQNTINMVKHDVKKGHSDEVVRGLQILAQIQALTQPEHQSELVATMKASKAIYEERRGSQTDGSPGAVKTDENISRIEAALAELAQAQ